MISFIHNSLLSQAIAVVILPPPQLEGRFNSPLEHTMRIIHGLLLLLLLCLSCRKKNTPEPEDPTPKLSGLLKTIIITTNGLQQRYDYEYLDSLTLSSISHTSNNKITKESFEYENDTLRLSYKGDTVTNYVYDAYGRLRDLEKRFSKNPDNYDRSRFYYYSTNNKLFIIERRRFASEIREHGIISYSDDFMAEITFTWDGNNVSKMKESLRDWVVINTEFQYDNTRDPLYDLYHKILRIPPDGIEGLSVNNYTEVDAITHGFSYKINREYNNNGLLIRKTILKQEKGKEDWTVYQDYTYSYYE